MLDPRRSYLKTVLIAGIGAGVGLLLAAWLLFAAGRIVADGAHVLGLALVSGATLVLVAVVGLGLVVVGGSIAIRRIGLEDRGLPYFHSEPNEWIPRAPLRWIVELARRAAAAVRGRQPPLRPGDLVEVKDLDEILATLDDLGTLEGLPFMEEMASYCGRRFRVFRRFEKFHDYLTFTGLRRMRSAVLLEQLRCDGSGHDGCQAGCHLIWKEAWLRLVAFHGRSAPDTSTDRPTWAPADRPDLEPYWRASSRVETGSVEIRYRCQATELARATTPLLWADPRHYMRDLFHGNARPSVLVRVLALAVFNGLQRRRGGVPFPYYENTGDTKSPHAVLDLEPGEMVRVRTKREIEPTLTVRRRNRGLWFDGEMLRWCGAEFRVARRIDHLIKERTGEMADVANPLIVLEGVSATGEYLALNPQNDIVMWREIWLERVAPAERRPTGLTDDSRGHDG